MWVSEGEHWQAKEVASTKALGQKIARHLQGTARRLVATARKVQERGLGGEGNCNKDLFISNLSLIFY